MVTDFKQLYYQDSYLQAFSAKILEVKINNETLALRLEQTAFYPEGGGQPGDSGIITIEASNLLCRIFDTQEEQGLIWQLCDVSSLDGREASSLVGLEAEGRIDWERRFDFMQQHSAEHILSGLVNKHFGYDNVGFHINETLMTIDFSGPLTTDEIALMERLCNEAINQNILYQIDYYTADEASKLSYRSKIDLPDSVRLVTVPGYDCCACCGTQVRSSGELGMLKVVDSMNYKGGVRLEVLAGKRAFEDYTRKHDVLRHLSRQLSSPIEAIDKAVGKLREEAEAAKFIQSKMERRLVRSLLAALPERITEPTAFKHSDLTKSAHKELAKALSGKVDSLVVVYGEMDDKSISFSLLAPPRMDARPLLNELKSGMDAKGGGKPGFIAGQIAAESASLTALEKILSENQMTMVEL